MRRRSYVDDGGIGLCMNHCMSEAHLLSREGCLHYAEEVRHALTACISAMAKRLARSFSYGHATPYLTSVVSTPSLGIRSSQRALAAGGGRLVGPR